MFPRYFYSLLQSMNDICSCKWCQQALFSKIGLFEFEAPRGVFNKLWHLGEKNVIRFLRQFVAYNCALEVNFWDKFWLFEKCQCQRSLPFCLDRKSWAEMLMKSNPGSQFYQTLFVQIQMLFWHIWFGKRQTNWKIFQRKNTFIALGSKYDFSL